MIETVSNVLYELGTSANQNIVTGVTNRYDFDVSIGTTFIPTNATKICVAFKNGGSTGSGGPTLTWHSGGGTFDSHISFVQPASALTFDASQIISGTLDDSRLSVNIPRLDGSGNITNPIVAPSMTVSGTLSANTIAGNGSGITNTPSLMGGGNTAIPLNTSARYLSLSGAVSSGTEQITRSISHRNLNVSKLSFYIIGTGVGPLLAGTNATLTLLTNAVATALTATLNGDGGATNAMDLTHSAVVLAGSTWNFKLIGNNTTATNVAVNYTFEAQ